MKILFKAFIESIRLWLNVKKKYLSIRNKPSKDSIAIYTATDYALGQVYWKLLVKKSIYKLSLDELHVLVKEKASLSVCIPIIIFKTDQLQKNLQRSAFLGLIKKYEDLWFDMAQLDSWYWEGEVKSYQSFRAFLLENVENLTISDFSAFMKLDCKPFEWNSRSTTEVQARFRDSLAGVYVGVNKLIKIKRSILNGNSVLYYYPEKQFIINTTDEFYRYVLKDIERFDVLNKRLEKEKRLPFV